uniref:Uncharacterized protein n=1 Tax=Oryza brachyantha TaxID=4533 RepID=J3MCB1_ORYBR
MSSQWRTCGTILPASSHRLQSYSGATWKHGSMDMSRRHGGAVPFTSLRGSTHGVSPPSPCATYPNVDVPVVTSMSVRLSRYTSAHAFRPCAFTPYIWCSSWLGWSTTTTSPVAVACSQYMPFIFS